MGHIGALAVALGVGGMFGSGLAWADESETPSAGAQSESVSSPSASVGDDAGGDAGTPGGGESTAGAGADDTAVDDPDDESPPADTELPADVESPEDEPAPEPVDTEDDPEDPAPSGAEAELPAPGDAVVVPESTPPPVPGAAGPADARRDPRPAGAVPRSGPSRGSDEDVDADDEIAAVTTSADRHAGSVTRPAARATVLSASSTSTGVSAGPPALSRQRPEPARVHPLITMVATVLDSVLAPLIDDDGPIKQANSPLLWTVLAWVRRQLEPYVAQRPRPPVAADVAGLADIPGVHDPVDDPDAVRHGLPEELERQVLIDGLVQPTDFRFLPNGDILVAEKGGAIKLFHDGHMHAEPVITLVTLPTDTDEERGLLGIELDPDFEHNGYLYVSYTTARNFDRLSRITVTGHTADPESEVVLMESDQPGNIYHHGGEVHFGPDGKLYWAMGMNTYNPNSQNLSNVHGKILRLNPDGTAPDDNPFLDTPGAIPQIWAYGLRNPFRFTFTPDGQLLSGDVGGDAWEELNIVTGGANYGWPSAEGVCANCGYVNPIYTYAHTPAPAKAGSITSVMVYTGDTLGEQYVNKVFIADYTLGWIKTLTFDSQFTSFISEEMFDDDAGTAVKLAQGPDGNIYQLNIFPGTLSRIVPSGGNRAPSAVITASKDNGLPPLAVDFSSAGSSDPDPGTTLTYAWDFGDGTTSTAANPTRVFSANGSYLVTLTVSDGEKTARATQRIVVGSTAPTATITTPVQNSQYSAGDVISFTGVGTDAEDGTLPDAAYKWTIQFGHADHVHPFRDNIIGPSGMVVLPRSSDNVDTTFYRITLTVTDSSGLSTTETVEIKPRLAPMTFTASDPNAVYTIDGIPHRGTYTEVGVVGVERVVGAVSPQYLPDGQLVFNSWSNGEAATHVIVTPLTGGAYTVNYDKFSTPPAPWREADIGHPTLTGYSSYDDGVFTIRGAGGDIWGPTDEMHYVYQSFDGDGTIIAHVTSQTDTDDWAKSGIIIKESATAGSRYVLLAVTPENGVTFQYDFDGDGGSAAYTFPNAWLKLERQGDFFRGYTSSDGLAWTLVGETTLAMAGGVTAGLAVTSHKYDTLNTTRFDNVSVVSGRQWTSADIGGPRLTGSTTHSGGTYTVTGSGDDIWGEADQMHLTYQSLPGDGEIVAHVGSFTGVTDGWAKAGVIVKRSAAAGAPYALLAVTPANGVNFQHGFTENAAAPTTGDWLKLVRAGNTVTGLVSADGVQWTEVGSATVALGDDAVIGLFVSAHDGSALATATFDQVSVHKSATSSVPPAPWVTEDVGAPRLAGSATYTAGTFTVNGAGDDIWGEADQFHFVHQTLTGDGDIVARVVAQESGTDGWAKSGVMIKQSATAGAPYVLVAVTPANGVTMQHGFTVDVGSASHVPGEGWIRLSRSGIQLTGYTSADGVSWTQLGTATLDLGADVEIGLFVTSHNGSQVNTSVFDHVVVTADVTAPAAVAV